MGADNRLVVRLVPPPDVGVLERLLQLVESHVDERGRAPEIRNVVWTIADLEAAAQRIASVVAKRHDIQLSRWGSDIEVNRVRLGYVGNPASMRTLLQELGYDDRLVLAEEDTTFSPAF